MDGLTEQDWMESQEVTEALEAETERVWREGKAAGAPPIVTAREENAQLAMLKEILRAEAPDKYLEPEQVVARYQGVDLDRLVPGEQRNLVARARMEAWKQQAPEMIPPEDPENPPENWLELLEGPPPMI